jgi:BTB/POZ domain
MSVADNLRDKIVANDDKGVETFLSMKKFCIHAQPSWKEGVDLINEIDELDYYCMEEEKEIVNVLNSSTSPGFSHLHYAVVNVYNNVFEDEASTDRALRIATLLLESGADPTATTHEITYQVDPKVQDTITTRMSPKDLLLCLVKNPWRIQDEDIYTSKLDAILVQMTIWNDSWEEQCPDPVVVPKGVFSMLAKLRSSITFDSMTFVCKDGEEVIAHPIILAASSPYFRAFFDGPWAETHPDGRWKTEHTSDLMNTMLDYLYTGHVHHKGFEVQGKDIYAAASEYEFAGLKRLARVYLSRGLSVDTVKETLWLAHLHDDEMLITACYEFVKKDPLRVVMNQSFAALSIENPDIWKELYKVILPDDEYRPYDQDE